MNRFADCISLTLNGNYLYGRKIVDFCRQQNDETLLSIAEFIQEWLNADPFISLKTSGSTGAPKTIRVHKDKMLVSALNTADYFLFANGDQALLCLPVQYIAGKMMIVRAMFSGLNLITIPPSQNPLEKLPPSASIDFAAMIPMQLNEIIDNPNLAQIKKILLGGGPMDASLEEKVRSLSTEIFHGYGMTETLSHIALRKVNGPYATLSYQALNGIQLDTDDRGCLTITAPELLDETLLTNDLVTFTAPNEFIWLGRYDHVIISGGIKLIPESIEKKLEPVFDCRFFLTGIKGEKLGEKLILIMEGDSLDSNQKEILNNKMNQLLDKYEVPKEIFFVTHFAETKSGKTDRLKTTQLALGNKI